MQSTLFHLHFATPDVRGAAGRLTAAGVPLQRRFGSVRGEGVSLGPADPEPPEFRFELQVHRRGAIDVTLAPGRRPHFDHLGLLVSDRDAVLARARDRGWSVREDERRPFVTTPPNGVRRAVTSRGDVTTPWGFRVEVHDADSPAVQDLGSADEARIETVVLHVRNPDVVRESLEVVFGRIPALELVEGAGPWVGAVELGGRAAPDGMEVETADLLAV